MEAEDNNASATRAEDHQPDPTPLPGTDIAALADIVERLSARVESLVQFVDYPRWTPKPAHFWQTSAGITTLGGVVVALLTCIWGAWMSYIEYRRSKTSTEQQQIARSQAALYEQRKQARDDLIQQFSLQRSSYGTWCRLGASDAYYALETRSVLKPTISYLRERQDTDEKTLSYLRSALEHAREGSKVERKALDAARSQVIGKPELDLAVTSWCVVFSPEAQAAARQFAAAWRTLAAQTEPPAIEARWRALGEAANADVEAYRAPGKEIDLSEGRLKDARDATRHLCDDLDAMVRSEFEPLSKLMSRDVQNVWHSGKEGEQEQ